MLNAVEISHLTVKYPDVKALDDVSFVVKEGDFLGIIGPNGAGKSTLFDSMLGLNTTYSGTIKFFDQDIRKSKKYHKVIGYVPQRPEFEKNFPAPLGPIMPKKSPSLTTKLTSSNAFTSGYFTVKFDISTAFNIVPLSNSQDFESF